MHAKYEMFESKWIGISLEMRNEEINTLINNLLKLKDREIGHFHIRSNDFGSVPGIADIEITTPEDFKDNLYLE